MKATAVIAEDEPLLAAALRTALAQQWPALEIVASVGDGQAAVDAALALQPDVLFLDVRMPGLDGLDAAAAIADEWPAGDDGRPPPRVVFVTAYDEYAVAAFERAAVDYVLKPVRPERLALTCDRLQAGLTRQHDERLDAPALDAALDHLRRMLIDRRVTGTRNPEGVDISAGEPPLRVLQAAVGTAIHLVPVDDVLYFEAVDKYVRVVTAAREYWLRTALRELLARLDGERFWQIHRALVVRADAIDQAVRDEAGRWTVTLRGHPARLAVSRLHSPRFKAM